MKINVVLASDLNYLPQSIIVFESILRAKKDSDYSFYLLCDRNNYSDEYGKIIEKFNSHYDVSIKILFVDGCITETESHISHISNVTYYRLLLPQLLPTDEKCIWLDSDTIVCDDLCEVVSKVDEDTLLTGVLAPSWQLMDNERKQNVCVSLDIEDLDTYVNAGVLGMNLKKMRQEGFVNKVLPLLNKDFSCQDQDIINKICYGGIKLLPLRYNLMTKVVIYEEFKKECIEKRVWTEEQVAEAFESPCVVHYADFNKPWKYKNSVLADLWWKNCNESIVKDMIMDKYCKFHEYSDFCKVNPLFNVTKYSAEWFDILRKYSHIYIYGAGIVGKRCLCRLSQNGIQNVSFLTTDEPEKATVEEISVNKFNGCLVANSIILVATSGKFISAIMDGLIEHGIFETVYVNDVL